MNTTGAASIGDSPMLELVAWASLIALAPGAVAVALAILKRCLTALRDVDAILRPPEEGKSEEARQGEMPAYHETRDRSAYPAYRPWER